MQHLASTKTESQTLPTGLAALGGIAAAAVGLLYISYAFGPTEEEVMTWGEIAFVGGLALALLAILTRRTGAAALRALLVLGLSVMALLQLPPALLWLLFHNQGISDGSPPSAFTAHWSYALLHVTVIVLCLVAVVQLLARPSTDPT